MLSGSAGAVETECAALQALLVHAHPWTTLHRPVVGGVGLAGLVAGLAEAGLPEEHNPILLDLQGDPFYCLIFGAIALTLEHRTCSSGPLA